MQHNNTVFSRVKLNTSDLLLVESKARGSGYMFIIEHVRKISEVFCTESYLLLILL